MISSYYFYVFQNGQITSIHYCLLLNRHHHSSFSGKKIQELFFIDHGKYVH